MTNKLFDRLHFSWGRQLPMIMQSEITECGHACVAMILGYFGHDIDLVTLRQRFAVNLRGVSVQTLIQMAEQFNLVVRTSRVEIEHLSHLQQPCILHWDMSHYVVLKKINGKRAIIHDPARGKLSISIEELAKSFTGVVLEFLPNESFELKKENRQLRLLEFWSTFSGIWASLIQIFVLALVLQIFVLLSPYYMQVMIDKVLPAADTDLLLVLGIAFAVLVVFENVVEGIRSWAILHLSSTLTLQMGSRLFSHLVHLPMGFFFKRHVGDIQSRFSSLKAVQDMLSTGFVSGIIDGVMLIITLAVMLVYNLKLTLIAVASTILFTVLQFVLFRPIKRATEEQIIKEAKESTNFLESLRAMQGIKLFNRQMQRHQQWLNYFANSINANIKLNKITLIYNSLQGLIIGLELVLLVWIGAYELLNNVFSVGMFYAFITYRRRFSSQTQSLLENIIQMLMLKLHLQRLADIVFQPEEANFYNKEYIDRDIKGSLNMVDVNFSYTDEPLIENASITVKVGESVAISGTSGCGKSTLMKLMMGLLQPSQGTIYIDDIPLNKLGLRNFRRQVGVVMQDDYLLSGSLLDNISFFDQNIDIELVKEVAKLAQIWNEIEMMPMGLQTLVGDMGSTLSGGQLQRILIARALYVKPKILFMDEATSHLDIDTEKKINNTIKDLEMTRIIIAHREETLQLADRVISFDRISSD